ncbi:hypothetical protein WH52_12460 [Tenacibaculum holothuriorum]|uniref:TonB-dependent receptor plug domain-containing protein n=1 Tax=Tenacibaculum holothuriorum TaxID=1635173 RepID=A0A1Y2P9Z6_9FLAO|nr:TonB-dependent receptor plug domain-containing protein [Tenacibaculum holothuriorum]OSY87266.1 hypothetical protein WH52_12460 [Tenacibaculum holothuriorum]
MKSDFLFKIIFFLCLSFSNFSFSQTEKEIFIIVKDDNNRPIEGAVILLDDIKQDKKTNYKGIFSIKTFSLPQKISAFSPYHGINIIKYNGKKFNRIIIKKKKDITPQLITKLKNKKFGIENAEQYRNIYHYLRGQVPGVQISRDNNIKIRGIGSVNGSTTPLFILNGVQIGKTTFENIIPTNVKHINILKGPETAIYGARGANGVIKITTY